jgi:ankyrin repeat protein
MVKLLLKVRNIDVNPGDRQMRMTPMQIAYEWTAKPAELNARDKREGTALIIVAEVGNGSGAKLLLKWPGIELNAQDSDGKTALHAVKGIGNMPNIDVVKPLLKAKAVCFAVAEGPFWLERTPLEVAQEKGFTEVVELLTA